MKRDQIVRLVRKFNIVVKYYFKTKLLEPKISDQIFFLHALKLYQLITLIYKRLTF